MGDWSQLIPDLLVSIARRIQLVEDFVAFGGVCSSWRAAATKDNFVKSWPTVPLLMLAEEKDCEDREFYSLSRGKIWRRLSLPEAKGKKCMESRGWFVTLEGNSGEMNLLHPFTRVQIELPNQKTFPDYELYEPENPRCFLLRAVLSADPSDTSDYVLVVVHSGGRHLGFWRPGDKSWTRIAAKRTGAFSDVNYYKGKFYAIDYSGRIWIWEDGDDEARFLFCIDTRIIDVDARQWYLVESEGELLIVGRDGVHFEDDEETYGATNFRVIHLDLVKSDWKEIRNLGERAIFVGHNSALSVDVASFPGIIKPNCIYFTDDSIEAYYWTLSQQGGGKDMGIYNLEDGKIERFDSIQSFSLIGPPVWISPSL
ncbi:hypothetical protein ACH5RR_041539 [Cinchona calisaya]|uniref:KIB1-4 beta-propeller domain-containing protein n=1 Tax=Cinchona calisaya TaxID=153742 RepID=A0ABD2XTX6_9GENT